ncbi:hypothetical protein EOPP23_13420 [Endozoicomonas sp. OPT23]|uniref:hypothetical protein n=1 Tax=Endozoicomonas sp. OPT23 TaxID=2072845 RepID=UPI00129B3545|nr:hypothetical protein [Endozoicomonas sp. OPT23]MRI33990.1 hypothetical protein [Endozoicomonas sp. OPT23]
MIKYAAAALSLAVSMNVSAFGLDSVKNATSEDVAANNVVAALKIIQDGGIQCDKITNFMPNPINKTYTVTCDGDDSYTLIDTDAGLVLKVD